MDRTLASLLAVLLGALSFAAGALSAFASSQRKAGREEGAQQYTSEKLGALEQRLNKLADDVNWLGAKLRVHDAVLDIAGQSGEVPRYVPRRSGENPAV